MTLNEIVDEFEETMKHTLKAGSIATYKNSYKCYAKSFFDNGNIQINDIDNNMVKTWWESILNAKTRTGKRYAKKTINNYIRTGLSVYLNYAVCMGYIKRNPLSSIPKYNCPDNISYTYENFWEINDFMYFLSFVDNKLYYCIFYIIFFTGLRIGEIIALTWEDVDFYNKKLFIKKDIRYVSEKGYLKSSPKSKKSVRTIELSNTCMALLEEIRETQINSNNYSLDKYVFGCSDFVRYCTVRNNFDKYVKQSGLKKITIHGLRHSHASLLINEGARDDLIAIRLGHSILTLHSTYSHIYENSKKEFYSILNKIENQFKDNQQSYINSNTNNYSKIN